jgi:hypothetical protein
MGKHGFQRGDKATRKYLAQYAEEEATLCERLRAHAPRFAHGLAIPCYAEGDGVAACLASIPKGSRGDVLVVLVVNAPAGAPEENRAANALTLERIRLAYGSPRSVSATALLYPHGAGALLVIDRATRSPLPRRQGVGLARKIGADVLLALAEDGQLGSPWIHCSDADVLFPPDYFEQSEAQPASDTAALLYRFGHIAGGDPRQHEAALQYEIALRYYVLGLRFAGSPYAFHSIGSTLAIEAGAYARVRGFPRLEAAEDFYLLNKLAKVGAVRPLAGDRLRLSSRSSFRVPFGTGAAVGNLLKAGEPALTTYDPRVFHGLRLWLGALRGALARPDSRADLRDSVLEEALLDSAIDGPLLVRALEETGALARAEAALAGPGKNAPKRLLDGFDGFRTLKLIHALRDAGLEDLPLRSALERSAFMLPAAGEFAANTAELARQVEALDAPRGRESPPATKG